MDIETMHQNVKLELDKTSALELPAFEPEEIDFWLNMAIRRFVKTRYASFEKSQKRIDDLRTLVSVYTDDTAGVGDYPNGYKFPLPVADSGEGNEDYWFTLQEEANIVVSGTETRVGVVESTVDEYRFRVDNPFSEHVLHYGLAKPLRIYNVDSVELISDGNYTVDDYHLTYLRVPATVDNVPAGTTDCDLPEHTHDEIVKLAANMMLENVEQPRYQTHMNEVNTME